MSDAFQGILSVLGQIRTEREQDDARSAAEVRQAAVERIAYDRDVRPVAVMETIVRALQPTVGSVSALERVIDNWLTGSGELGRILKKHVRDQIDARAVAAFFRDPVAEPKTGRASRVADTAAKAPDEAPDEIVQQAPAEIEEEDEVQHHDAAADEDDDAAADQDDDAAADEDDDAAADQDDDGAADQDDDAAADQDDDEEEEASGRTLILDEDVAGFFEDADAVNDFLRAAVAAMRNARRAEDDGSA